MEKDWAQEKSDEELNKMKEEIIRYVEEKDIPLAQATSLFACIFCHAVVASLLTIPKKSRLRWITTLTSKFQKYSLVEVEILEKEHKEDKK